MFIPQKIELHQNLKLFLWRELHLRKHFSGLKLNTSLEKCMNESMNESCSELYVGLPGLELEKIWKILKLCKNILEKNPGFLAKKCPTFILKVRKNQMGIVIVWFDYTTLIDHGQNRNLLNKTCQFRKEVDRYESFLTLILF